MTEGAYVEGKILCWWCGKMTRVYTWPGHELWPENSPEIGRPATVRKVCTNGGNLGYWGNVCEHCGRVQGDWFVYCEPQPNGGFVFGDQELVDD